MDFGIGEAFGPLGEIVEGEVECVEHGAARRRGHRCGFREARARHREEQGKCSSGMSPWVHEAGVYCLRICTQVGIRTVPALSCCRRRQSNSRSLQKPRTGPTSATPRFRRLAGCSPCNVSPVTSNAACDVLSLRILVAPERIEVEFADLVSGQLLLLFLGKQLRELRAQNGGLRFKHRIDIRQAVPVKADGAGAFGIAVPIPVVKFCTKARQDCSSALGGSHACSGERERGVCRNRGWSLLVAGGQRTGSRISRPARTMPAGSFSRASFKRKRDVSRAKKTALGFAPIASRRSSRGPR